MDKLCIDVVQIIFNYLDIIQQLKIHGSCRFFYDNLFFTRIQKTHKNKVKKRYIET